MIEFRCSCNRLLAKIDEGSRVQIKCPKCERMNEYDGSGLNLDKFNAAFKETLPETKANFDRVMNETFKEFEKLFE